MGKGRWKFDEADVLELRVGPEMVYEWARAEVYDLPYFLQSYAISSCSACEACVSHV
jgi:hypothetical protein